MRFLYFVPALAKFTDSILVFCCAIGYPLIAPDENGDASIDKFFSERPTAVDDLVGPDPGVGPDGPGEREAPKQYCDNKQYDYELHGQYPFKE